MMIKYIVPFVEAFLLSVFFIAITVYLARKINWEGRQSARHIRAAGKSKVFRVGGIAMVLAFNLAIFLNKDLFISPELYGVMAATFFLMLFGTWDDLKEIIWKFQLFFQISIALMVFIMGVRIYYFTNPIIGSITNLDVGRGVVFSAVLVIAWIVLLINSMNWLDGIDGLSGGVSLIGTLTIFFLSLKPEVNQPPVAIIAIILAGSILGFLIFNFYPSKVLAGTSGSMFMGFTLAALAIFSGTKIATAILVMALPIIDFLWVIGERARNKKSIFKPDKNHLHYKLLELGWSQRKINTLFYLITTIMAVVALNTRAIGKSVTFLLAMVVMAATLVIISRKIKKIGFQK
jgi:UDP-GlcNAc:undecaprenyl-phosphate/decaprenyl-phosphate GlcNAc-1-phosphate transferase